MRDITSKQCKGHRKPTTSSDFDPLLKDILLRVCESLLMFVCLLPSFASFQAQSKGRLWDRIEACNLSLTSSWIILDCLNSKFKPLLSSEIGVIGV
jgi:hypothetical protein